MELDVIDVLTTILVIHKHLMENAFLVIAITIGMKTTQETVIQTLENVSNVFLKRKEIIVKSVWLDTTEIQF